MATGGFTQEEGIPLFNSPRDKDSGFRLIEITPELQSLLESDTAPVLV